MYTIENNAQGNPMGIRRETDGAFIPLDPANSDYQAYLAEQSIPMVTDEATSL